MAEGIGKSLKQVIVAFKNVLGRLIRQHPVIFLTFMAIITYGLIMFTKSEQRMTFGLCILISFVSILIYTRNKNYAETLLSFMLGVLTIFTIKWDTYTSRLFIGFYVAVNIIIFFLTSIRLAMKVETELTAAASYIDLNNFKNTYKKLQRISKVDTQYNALGGIERAETIKHLAYTKVPIEEIEESVRNIELIKVVFQTDLKESCDFFKTLFYIKERTDSYFSITNLLDLIVAKRLPLTPEEFLTILNQTKKVIINNVLTIDMYLNLIDESVFDGEDVDGIINRIKKEMAVANNSNRCTTK
ncbi:hypothetical protein [Marinifilum sp.]|uniref:hypothetical protein n=1 Tax=Marinifilum sp. TaxID=2033137 RepID=UPI003BA92439